ncbi:olfactory receptor 5AP2-like [Pseudophryne corroboree]|uniref:olfactory receptor 5AP2-like n=1 Tax=Pseudophryne corroboree TaxID=495146 RepID=UPI003081A64A
MDIRNVTQVRVFVLSGLTDNEELVPFLFLFFLLVYLMTILGNVGMMGVVYKTSSLHTPMYFFLIYLSMIDLCYSSVITPKVLLDLLSKVKSISFTGCALQFFFFAVFSGTEVLLLSIMSYDRYIAICHPLHYVLIMTNKRCLSLVLLSLSIAFFQAILQTICVFSLQYCGSNLIDHFYCDVLPLLTLSCSSTLPCEIITIFFTCSCGVSSMMTIVISYTLIVSSILRIRSGEGRQKAFSTCSSHLMCVFMLYGTVFFIYLRPSSSHFEKQDKVVSVFYLVVIPMLNPLIYSLRNKEVKKVIMKAVQKCHLLVLHHQKQGVTEA